MVDPRELFEHPEEHIVYLTGNNPEGQYFDRKEVWSESTKQLKEARKNIVETVSAFTNARGGLLALGIDDAGNIVGLNHLDEATYNSLVQNLNEQLTNHQARSRDWWWQGQKLLLIYAPEGASGICETAGSEPKGWKREAANNLRLTPQDRERLLRERSQRFEHLTVCDYDPQLIHQAVFDQFRRLYLQEREANYQDNQEAFLRNIGAVRLEAGRLQFTYAGYLFFANNPRNQLPSAYVRLLKYESESIEQENPGCAVFDRDVDGCLPELLRKVRSFVNDSPYFRRYSYRDPQGSGIKEEPEYPLSAVEEAIVNAMIHRDYHSQQPIVCCAYRDAFVVRSPGRLQQDSFVPTRFTLREVRLTPYRRNVQLVEWARLMRDENEQRFVRSLAEGTRTMLERMREMNLPAPEFNTNGYTAVTFFNRYQKREVRYGAITQALDLQTLKTILQQGEDSLHEFKRNISSATSLASEIAAFANTEGGFILIGLEDDGRVNGLTQADVERINHLIWKATEEMISPPVNVLTRNHRVDGSLVMFIQVEKGQHPPYTVGDGSVWVRNGVGKRLAGLPLAQETKTVEVVDVFPADEQPIPHATLADLHYPTLEAYVERIFDQPLDQLGISTEQLLRNLKFYTQDTLNLTGLLMLAKRPQQFRPQFNVKAVSYFGNSLTGTKYRDRQDIDGRIPELYEGTMAFLLRNLRRIQAGQGFNSEGKLEIPRAALEEIVQNALIHRDYFISAPLRIMLFDDRLEVISPGTLPNSLTVEHIKTGAAIQRNPTLASRAFRVLPYNGLGSGVPRAVELVPDIQFDNQKDANQLVVTIPRPVVG